MIAFRVLAVVLLSVHLWIIPELCAQEAATRSVTVRGPGNAEAINADQLRDFLSFIASDETQGRGTPSRGLDATAQFIASHLTRLNLTSPVGSGTFFQRIGLKKERVAATTHATFAGRQFSFGEDFIVNVLPGAYEGSVVYVGHGWVIRSKGIDAYEGLDVRDKIVIVTETGLPSGLTRDDLRGVEGGDWESPQPALRRRGARAMIMVPSFGPLLEWQRRVRDSAEYGIMSVIGNQSPPPVPVVRPSLSMFQALLEGEEHTALDLLTRAAAGDPVPSFPLSPDKRFMLQVEPRSDTLATQNVVGMLEGSDPILKNEYVIVSAHYDHLGIGRAVDGDSIYNGADDDGSGTAAVMAIAEAFARGQRPRRSVVFVWHAGEEQSLWGSSYFVQRPPVPLAGVVATLNIDMIGRTRTPQTDSTRWSVVRPGEIYVIGSKRISRELGEISEAANQSYLRLGLNYRFDAADDPSQLFFRSDHYSYAEKGIPVIFYYGGEHEDYHQPSDETDKIDYQNMEKVTRTVYATAWELANRAERPRVEGRAVTR